MTMDVSVKTLDGQNRSFIVEDTITVKEFKDRIASSIEIASDVQRLIFQGRVLQDEKLLKEYGVHLKVIHVVQRPPPGSRPPTSNSGTSSTPGGGIGGGNPNVNSFVVGSFTLPSDAMDPTQVQNIVQQAMNNLGDVGRNARVTTRSSPDGLSVGVDINLGRMPLPVVASESARRLQNAKHMLKKANDTIDRLENQQVSGGNSDSGAGSPMDTSSKESTTTATASSATANSDNNSSTTDAATATPQTNQSTSTSTQTQSEGAADNSQSERPRVEANHPPSSALADLLEEMSRVNSRLEPHLQKYQSILRNQTTYESESEERRESQRVCNLVSEVIHYISHCNHSVSDLMIDMSQAPPRCLRAPPSVQGNQSASILRQSIPVEAQINIGVPVSVATRASGQAPPTSSTTNSGSSTTTAPNTATTTTAQNIQPGVRISNQGQTTTASSNPYVFMEVGPDSVTINRITAQVVSSSVDQNVTGTPASTTTAQGSTRTTEATTTSAGTPTSSSNTAPSSAGQGGQPINIGPNFMQDMIQMMTQSVTQGMAGRPMVVIPGMPGAVGLVGVPRPGAPGPNTGRPTAPGPNTGRPTPPSTPSVSSSTTTSAARPRPTSVPTTLTGSFGAFTPPGGQRTAAGTATTTPGGHVHIPVPPGAIPMGINIPMGQMTGGHPVVLMPDGGNLGTMRPVDQFLPCQSRHFTAQRAQAAAQNQPENSLADVVTNLVQDLIGQPIHTHSSSTTGLPTVPEDPNSNNTTGGASTQTTSAQSGPIPVNSLDALFPGLANAHANAANVQGNVPFADMLRTVLQQSQRTSSATTSTSAATSTSSTSTGSSTGAQTTTPSAGPALTDDAFADLVTGIGDYVTRSAMGQQPQDSIYDFLSRLGESHNILPSEGRDGFVNDLFMCLARHMTFPDLISVFYGQPVPLNHLRGPLREFVRDNVLQGIEFSQSNVQESVDRLVRDLEPSVREALEGASLRPGIDGVATVNLFARRQLTQIINLILHNRSGQNDFGQALMDCCRKIMSELISLGRYCLTGGLPAFENIIRERVRHVTEDTNPMIQQWMVSMSSQQLSALTRTLPASEESIMQYLVNTSTGTPPVTSTVDSREEATVTSTQKQPDSRPAQRQTPLSEANMASHEAMDVDSMSHSHAAVSSTGKPTRTPKTPTTSSGATSVSSGGEAGVRGDNWQSLLPADWVPIITADVDRQRRQHPNGPFSDAYLHGMPSKRRKMMTEDKPKEDLSHEQEYIPQALKRAVAAAQVEPISSLENMVAEASEDNALQAAFQGQVEGMIRTRLQNDSDFCSEKYPNSQEYFKENKK